MPDPVLDTMVLQGFGFGHPNGLAILLAGLAVSRVRVPAEVYNQDEDALPLGRPDRGISEFGQGLRFAKRRVAELPATDAVRYQRWLTNAQQLATQIENGAIIITGLDIEEIRQQEDLIASFGIGRGEAACLFVALRERSPIVFVSSDEFACKVAQCIDIPYLTLSDIFHSWIARSRPSTKTFEELVAGMASARFRFRERELAYLRREVRENDTIG